MVFWTLLPFRITRLSGVSEELIASILRVTARCKNPEYRHLNIKILRNPTSKRQELFIVGAFRGTGELVKQLSELQDEAALTYSRPFRKHISCKTSNFRIFLLELKGEHAMLYINNLVR
jgi:hypothetical protein